MSVTTSVHGNMAGFHVYRDSDGTFYVSPYQAGNVTAHRTEPEALAALGGELRKLEAALVLRIEALAREQGELVVDCPRCGDSFYLDRTLTCPTHSCSGKTP